MYRRLLTPTHPHLQGAEIRFLDVRREHGRVLASLVAQDDAGLQIRAHHVVAVFPEFDLADHGGHGAVQVITLGLEVGVGGVGRQADRSTRRHPEQDSRVGARRAVTVCIAIQGADRVGAKRAAQDTVCRWAARKGPSILLFEVQEQVGVVAARSVAKGQFDNVAFQGIEILAVLGKQATYRCWCLKPQPCQRPVVRAWNPPWSA